MTIHVTLELIWSIVKVILIVVFSVNFAFIAWHSREKWMSAYCNISWSLMLLDLVVVMTTLSVCAGLYLLSPTIMGFGILRLIGGPATNVAAVGFDVPYFGIVFCLLFMACLPILAEIEEKQFREGTTSWSDGIRRSIVFGFVHMAMGVPLAAAFALIIPGLFYTAMYFKGGVPLATQAHFQYNLILVSLLLLISIGITLGA